MSTAHAEGGRADATGVPAGQYVVESSGYTTSTLSIAEPFAVG